jgi:hypothetical protein
VCGHPPADKRVFERLSARPDLARLDAPLRRRRPASTIDRHVTNILTKLDVRSRTAATTYAFDHKLF